MTPDMQHRLDPPSGRVRLLIDTDTANEIDDQFAIAWALFRHDRLTVEAITAAPFSFRHHIPELQAAEAAMRAGKGHEEHLLGGFQGWIGRLHAQGRSVDDLNLVGPAEGMELSHAEILRVCAACGTTPPVYRGAPRYAAHHRDIVWSDAAEAIVRLLLG